jgi:hypothetical protein
MNLYAELIGRLGSAQAELENMDWESVSIPGERRIDFSGIALRLGVRWI